MKTEIHPKYVEAEIRCACGNVIKTRSTKPHDYRRHLQRSAIPSTPASRSSWIPPAAWTNSSSAWPRPRPPRPPTPPNNERESSPFPPDRPQEPQLLRAAAFAGRAPLASRETPSFLPMDLRPHIEKFARRLAEVETALSDPKAVRQSSNARRNWPANTPGSRI